MLNYFLHNKEDSFIIKGELLRENESSYSSNRSIKDTVLRLLLDDEEVLLQLFNALEGTDYEKKDVICINTLTGAIFNSRRNDLSFSVEDWYLSLIEHQSTLTDNIPLRMFIYLGRVYEQILDMVKAYRKGLYKIPLPRLYMLYNGTEDFPQEMLLRLSKAFREAPGIADMEPSMELVVKAININTEKKHPLLEQCPILKEYSLFIERVRAKLAAGDNRDIAVKNAIRECIEENILRNFLLQHGKEVYNMLFDEITYEDIMRIRLEEELEQGREQGLEQGREQGLEQGREQGIAQGLEQGVKQEREEIAIRMKNANMPLDAIREFTQLSEEAIRAL